MRNPGTAPVVFELYKRFGTGRYSLKTLVKEFKAEGVRLRGRKLYSSFVHQILRKRLYTGEFGWNGVIYKGSHEPLVTGAAWLRVQELLASRAETIRDSAAFEPRKLQKRKREPRVREGFGSLAPPHGFDP